MNVEPGIKQPKERRDNYMNPFIVLVSKHRWQDKFTTQLDVFVESEDKDSARAIVRIEYPAVYIRYYDNGKYIGKIAYFTGEIHGL